MICRVDTYFRMYLLQYISSCILRHLIHNTNTTTYYHLCVCILSTKIPRYLQKKTTLSNYYHPTLTEGNKDMYSLTKTEKCHHGFAVSSTFTRISIPLLIFAKYIFGNQGAELGTLFIWNIKPCHRIHSCVRNMCTRHLRILCKIKSNT